MHQTNKKQKQQGYSENETLECSENNKIVQCNIKKRYSEKDERNKKVHQKQQNITVLYIQYNGQRKEHIATDKQNNTV